MKVLKALPTKVKTQNPDQMPDVACKVQQAGSMFISQPVLTMLLATLAFLKFLECNMPPQSLGIAVPSFWNAVPLLPPPFHFLSSCRAQRSHRQDALKGLPRLDTVLLLLIPKAPRFCSSVAHQFYHCL